MKKIKDTFLLIVVGFYHYFGIRFIVGMIITPKLDDLNKQDAESDENKSNKKYDFMNRKPANFILWLIGIISFIYGIKLNIYEIRVSRLWEKYGSIVEQLDTKHNKAALIELIRITTEEVPQDPTDGFWSFIPAVFGKPEPYQPIVNLATVTIQEWVDDYAKKRIEFNNFRLDSLKLEMNTNLHNQRGNLYSLKNGRTKKLSIKGENKSGPTIELVEINDIQVGQSTWKNSEFKQNDIGILNFESKKVFICLQCDWTSNEIDSIAVGEKSSIIFIYSKVDRSILETHNIQFFECEINSPTGKLSFNKNVNIDNFKKSTLGPQYKDLNTSSQIKKTIMALDNNELRNRVIKYLKMQ